MPLPRWLIDKLIAHLPPESRRQISDGYHTMEELYLHRNALFVALLRSNPGSAWRARKQDDGVEQPGWFLAGMRMTAGEISYHLPEECWELLDGAQIQTLDKAPPFDGHSSWDVLFRLQRSSIVAAQDYARKERVS